MSNITLTNLNRVSSPALSRRSRSCDEIYGSSERGRCCCTCLNCACRSYGDNEGQAQSRPISVRDLVVNAQNIYLNSVCSNGSCSPASGNLTGNSHLPVAPSLQFLGRSPAHRSDRQMREDARNRFLEDVDDFNPRLFTEPSQMDDTTMPASPYPMEIDDMNETGRADRSSSIDMLSEYAQSFVGQSLSNSGLLVGMGAGAIERHGNKFLELTERRRLS